MSADHLAIWGEQLEKLTRGRPKRRQPESKPPASPPNPSDMLTLDEAAARMRVCTKTFRSWPVPRFKHGNVVLISRKDLDDFIASKKVTGHDDQPEAHHHG